VSRTEADASTVGATIEALAGAYRVRQDELAQLAGISKQALNNIIRGRSMPSLATANALATLFGISTQALVSEPTSAALRASIAVYDSAPIHEARKGAALGARARPD
jgi:DNA-binding XRE family transcriptional regulator